MGDLKESNFIKVAVYVLSGGIDNEPTFMWWGTHTMKRKDRIIAAVNNMIRKKTHKYGIRLSNSVKDASNLDKVDGNEYWTEVLAKERQEANWPLKYHLMIYLVMSATKR